MNYLRYLNSVCLRRRPSPIRKLTELLAQSPRPTIPFATGAPATSMFPFKDLTISLHDGGTIQLSDSSLATALQYLPSQGYGPLVHWMKSFQKAEHHLINDNFDLAVTCGSQDALSKAFEMTYSERRPILLDSPMYPGVLAILEPMNCEIIPVKTDRWGTIAEDMEEQLKSFSDKAESERPQVFYSCPFGHNPTGSCVSLERKRAVYQLASKYNLLIFEDDPYYFLQFSNESIPSYLSMDTDGRVLRFDSFSKVLSSGMRLGAVSGPKSLVNRIVLHMQSSIMHTSSLSQVIAFELLNSWERSGFLTHASSVANYYRSQRNLLLSALKANNLEERLQYEIPEAGMFLWAKLIGIDDSSEFVELCMDNDVLVVPGYCFLPLTGDKKRAISPFVRISYSMASADQIHEGVATMSRVLDAFST